MSTPSPASPSPTPVSRIRFSYGLEPVSGSVVDGGGLNAERAISIAKGVLSHHADSVDRPVAVFPIPPSEGGSGRRRDGKPTHAEVTGRDLARLLLEAASTVSTLRVALARRMSQGPLSQGEPPPVVPSFGSMLPSEASDLSREVESLRACAANLAELLAWASGIDPASPEAVGLFEVVAARVRSLGNHPLSPPVDFSKNVS